MTAQTDAPADLAGLATAYARSHDAADLSRLRAAVRRSRGFDPGLDLTGLVAPLLARGEHAACVEAVRAAMPGAFFSPSAHHALAAAHEALGDSTRAWREQRTARLALASVLTTGAGTRASPWSVLRLNDEYDVLRSQGRASSEQSLLIVDGRSIDRHVCDDGSEAWFDVTGLVAR